MFIFLVIVVVIIALFLDLIFYRYYIVIWRDSGRYWWKKFRVFDVDIRSEEFYSFLWGFNKYFLFF